MGLEPILSVEAPGAGGTADEETAEGKAMIGKPYKVGGRWFHPKEDEDYDETGLASWYGAEFHGLRTANGERFNPALLTGAHPTLPLPSFVRVTNVDTGTAAVVRINDRGPFGRGRIVDVSRAVAEKLKFRGNGSAKVRVEYLGPAPVGGGDEETLLAEAKFGSSPDKGRGIGRFIPSFGLGGSDEEEDDRDTGEVEVRLARAEPARGASTLPGVEAPTSIAFMRESRPAAPLTAVASTSGTSTSDADLAAYQEPADDGVDALLAMEADEPVGEAVAASNAAETPADGAASAPAAPVTAAIAPLRAAEPKEAESRILGAHELFAAIDATSGGAGELNGIAKPE